MKLSRSHITPKAMLRVALRLSAAAAMLSVAMTDRAAAQDRYTVAGTVLDAETGESLPHASVVLEGTSFGVAANVDGHFAVVGIPPGSYTLRVTYLGYQPATLDVTPSESMDPLRVQLRAVVSGLDEVFVSADSYRFLKAGGEVSQLTVSPTDAAVLATVGEVDIFRSLQLLPGISGTNEGSSGLYVRGGTPDQNLVLLDGMTVYHVDHFFGLFSAFNADAIKDVRVFKGGYPATYGGRTSSIVDLTGRTGGTKYGMGVGVNLLSAGGLAEVPLGSKGSVLVSARRSYTDVLQTGLYNSIYETLTGEGGQTAEAGGFRTGGGPQGGALRGGFRGPGQVTVQPDFYFYDLNAKLTFRPGRQDVLALTVYNGQDNLDESRYTTDTITQGGGGGADIRTDVYDVTGWGNVGMSGKWSRQWSPRLYSNALVAYSQVVVLADVPAQVVEFDP